MLSELVESVLNFFFSMDGGTAGESVFGVLKSTAAFVGLVAIWAMMMFTTLFMPPKNKRGRKDR